MPTDQKGPDTRGVAQSRMAEAVTITRDVFGGTLSVRKKGETYLPRFEGEETADYAKRLKQAVLFNAFKRTVKGLVGMIHRKPIDIADAVPEVIRADLENVDLAGRHVDVFARDISEDAWIDGHGAILVDMQAVEPGALPTLDDERAAGLRPYWVEIRKHQILRSQTINIAGRTVLDRFAYSECVTEADGEYGEREVERVRDYRRVAADGKVSVVCIVHTKRKHALGAEQWETDPPRTMSIGRIPVVTHYTDRTGFMESDPPLLDLALENILHYQVRSDRQNVLHIASVPIPVFRGLRQRDGEVKVGVNNAILVDVEGGADYLEPKGAALQHSADELKDIEQRMAYLGLSMLMSESRAAETATSKEIDKSESDSAIEAAARDEEDALEAAIELHAEWRGIVLDKAGEDRWVRVNREFVKQVLSPQMAQLLLAAVDSGRLTVETMWDAFQRGDVLPTTFDPEAERERLGNGELPPLVEDVPTRKAA